jgi:hypothetical protein
MPPHARVAGQPRAPVRVEEHIAADEGTHRMSWTWRLESADGAVLDEPESPPHPSQSDAESWLGETWRELLEAGVAQATLLDAGSKVYGPMPLTES